MNFRKLSFSNINNLYLLICVAILIRIIFFFTYAPIGYPDTGWYEKLAKEIITWNFSEYDGARTPVYPIILIIGLIKWKLVWLIQMAFGVANTILFYLIILKATNNQKFSFWSGIGYNFSLILLFFESNLLTETICIFFLLLTAYYFQRTTEINKPGIFKKNTNYLILSLAVTFATLTRPTFAYIYPLLFLFIIYDYFKNRDHNGALFKKLSFYILPFLVLVGGWSTFNKIKVDYFGPTTLTGFHFIEHSGAFIEYAPDEYADLRDLYLKYRKIKISETGEQTTTVYMVYPEIQKNKGYSIARISKELTAVSFWLFYHYPGLYFKSVARAYFDFWLFPNFIDYWDLNKFRFKLLQVSVAFWVKLELYFWIVIKLFFLAGSILYLFSKNVRNDRNKMLLIYLISTVISLSLIQALVQYGDNWRFSVAVKPFIILTILILAFNIKRGNKENFISKTE